MNDIKALNKKYATEYKQGRTTKPDPDTLIEVDMDDPKWKQKDGYYDMDLMREAMDKNETIIRGWDDEAKKNKRWLGRTLTDGVGDGYAVYVVTKENKKTVRIQVCYGLGDDWVSRHFGEECLLDKDIAEDFLPCDFNTKREVPKQEI